MQFYMDIYILFYFYMQNKLWNFQPNIKIYYFMSIQL